MSRRLALRTPRRSRKPLAAGLALLALTVTTACAGGDGAGGDDTIDIGVSIPMTGVGLSTCLPIQHGAQSWIDKVNADGGIDGKQIKIHIEDDLYTAAEALTNTRQFVADDDIVAIYNACGSAPGAAIQTFAKQQRMPFLFSWVDLPGEEKSENFYTLVPGNGDMVSAMASTLMKEKGPGSLYLMTYELPGIESAIDQIEKTVKDAGGEFLGHTIMTLNQPDMNAQVLKAKSLNPDYIATIVGSTDSAKLVNTIDDQDAWPGKAVITSTSAATAAFAGALNDGVDLSKVVTTSGPAAASDPSAASCVEAFGAYKGDYKIVPDAQALTGCTNAQALVAVLQSVEGEITRASILKTLEGWSSEDAVPSLGPLSFAPGDHLGVKKVHGIRFQGREMVPAFEAPLVGK